MTRVSTWIARGAGRPAWDPTLPDWQRRAAAVMHALLYCLLLAAPVLGYLTACTAPARVPTLFLGVIPVPHLLGANAASPSPGCAGRTAPSRRA